MEGYAGMPNWFRYDNAKGDEIMNIYDELAAYYGY
jgi:hypothetical protein